MPVLPLRIRPGVNIEATPTLNEGGWSQSALVRFFGGLAQKIGGWMQYTTFQFVGIVRGLHAWQTLNQTQYLGVATENHVYVIDGDTGTEITPVSHTSDNQLSIIFLNTDFVTVNLVDPGYTPSVGQFVNFPLPVPVDAPGGFNFLLYGSYQIIAVPGPGYQIKLPQRGLKTAGFQLQNMPFLSVTAGMTTATITGLPNSYAVGNTFVLGLTQTVAAFSVPAGNYRISGVLSPTSFQIDLPSSLGIPSTSGMAQFNGGITYQIYSPNGAGGSIGPPSLQYSYWTMDNWGEFLIFAPYLGAIFVWQPEVGGPAQVIATAPNSNIGIFVAMPEQILVAYGSSGSAGSWNPLLIAWCDVSDYTDWTPTATNQAGSFLLPSGSTIVRGLQAPQQMLFWTDIELWAAQYIGFPLVFGFNKIGQACGLIAPLAVAQTNNGIYWMSNNQFYVLNANGVSPIPCPVWDQVFQNLSADLVGKIMAAPNSFFSEVSWFFPSKLATQENDSYVKLNLMTGEWDYGSLDRTVWIDQSILGAPIAGNGSGLIFQHEIGYDQVVTFPSTVVTPLRPFIETGYIMIAEGNNFTFVDQVYPDIRFGSFQAQINQDNSSDTTKGTVMVTVYMVNYPGDEPRIYGPYPVDARTRYIPLRARGRQMKLRFSSDDEGLFWRIGLVRYRGQPAGRR